MSSNKLTLPCEDDACLIEHLYSRLRLRRLGYKYTTVGNEKITNGHRRRTISFSNNDKAGRLIEISIGDCAGPIYISNTNSGKSFSVDDWILRHPDQVPGGIDKHGFLAMQLATKKKGIEPLLDFLKSLFLGPLLPILSGAEWEDVPFDWDEYK
jgi:hypothetical protein